MILCYSSVTFLGNDAVFGAVLFFDLIEAIGLSFIIFGGVKTTRLCAGAGGGGGTGGAGGGGGGGTGLEVGGGGAGNSLTATVGGAGGGGGGFL